MICFVMGEVIILVLGVVIGGGLVELEWKRGWMCVLFVLGVEVMDVC